jgi:hypothetical protein
MVVALLLRALQDKVILVAHLHPKILVRVVEVLVVLDKTMEHPLRHTAVMVV